AGGSSILYEADQATPPSQDDLDAAVQMIRSRLDMLNYTEATVTSSGNNQILVEIPGISDPEQAVQQLGASAVLQFRDADGNVIMDGKDVSNAKTVYGNAGNGYNEYYISLTLKSEAVSKFSAATAAAAAQSGQYDSSGRAKNYIAIYLDENQVSAPSVSKQIDSDSCIITGSFTKASADYLSGVISAGKLPFALKDVQLTATGPSLGQESLQTSLFAGALGVILVMIFMIAFYRLPGFIASIALVAYVAIMGIILVISQTNLSLPGIAGIILSVGMAVDANIVIFERVKDELRNGKTIRTSMEHGFKRALTAVIDSHMTTLIASIVLWIAGTGPIVGFAITLFIGVLLSLFTAVVVTRWLLNQIVGMRITHARLYGL
ncbi:MAG: protein translocase subunit SecD, partial [Oscillospiraceae bacterium]|nr:protein translocase subunit SecD [Oscillospiraceae bacterium]